MEKKALEVKTLKTHASIPTERIYVNEIVAAEMLALNRKKMQAMWMKGTGPNYYKFGRAVRYKTEELIKWAEDQKIKPYAE